MVGEGDAQLADVDAWTLFHALSEKERQGVENAWREPAPASQDGVVAAVAVHRLRKQRRWVWWWAILAFGWFMLYLPWPGDDRSLLRVLLGMAWWGLVAGFGVWRLVRHRSALRCLAPLADVGAAAHRARELRASSGGRGATGR